MSIVSGTNWVALMLRSPLGQIQPQKDEPTQKILIEV